MDDGLKCKCCVEGCFNRSSDTALTFFKLPSNSARRNEWLRLIGRQDLLSKTCVMRHDYRVCSVHFSRSMMFSSIVQKLHTSAMPTKCIPAYPAQPGITTCDASTQTMLRLKVLADNVSGSNAQTSKANKQQEVNSKNAKPSKPKLIIKVEKKEEQKGLEKKKA